MIPLPHRQKGGSPQLGVRHEGDVGPFGKYGALEDAEDDGQADEQPDEGTTP